MGTRSQILSSTLVFLLPTLLVLALLPPPLGAHASTNTTKLLSEAYKSLPKTPDPLARCPYCHRVTKPSQSDCLSCHSSHKPPSLFNASLVHRLHYEASRCPLYTRVPPYCELCHKPTMAGTLQEHGHPTRSEAAKMGKKLEDCTSCHLVEETSKGCLKCHGRSAPHLPGYSRCELCHGTLPTPSKPVKPPHLSSIHGSRHEKLLEKVKAKNICLVCHDKETGYRMLRLAREDTKLPYNQVARLCGQEGCHPKVYKLWLEGKHHSNLPPQLRGTCTDSECHNPHYPSLPKPGTPEEFLKHVERIFTPAPLLALAGVLVAIYIGILFYHRILPPRR